MWRVALILPLLLALTASRSARAQDGPILTPPNEASAALCAALADRDEITRDACHRSCTQLPTPASCHILRRFGYDGWAAGGELFEGLQRGVLPDWPRLERRYPGFQAFLEFHLFPPHVRPPWRSEAQQQLIQLALKHMSAFDALSDDAHEAALKELNTAKKHLSDALGADHPILAVVINNQSTVYLYASRLKEAEAASVEALRLVHKTLGPEDPFASTVLDNLGLIQEAQGRYHDSIDTLQRADKISLLHLGPDNRSRATLKNNLAITLYKLGRVHEAREASAEALRIAELRANAPHKHLGKILGNLATFHAQLGEFATARRFYERDLRETEQRLGPDHTEVALNLNNFGVFLVSLNDLEPARRHLERALELSKKHLSADHPRIAETSSNLATVYDRLGMTERAVELETQALKARERSLGKDHPDLANSLNNLAVRLSRSHPRDAAKVYQRAIQIEAKALGAKHPRLVVPTFNLGVVQQRLGAQDEAYKQMSRALELCEPVSCEQLPDILEALALLDHKRHKLKPAFEAAQRAEAVRSERFWRAARAVDSDAQLIALSSRDRDGEAVMWELAWRQERSEELWRSLLERTGRAAYAERQRRDWLRLLAQRPAGTDALWARYEAAQRHADDLAARVRSASASAQEVTKARGELDAATKALIAKWPQLKTSQQMGGADDKAMCALLREEGAAMIHWLRFPAQAMERRGESYRAVIAKPDVARSSGCVVQLIDLGEANEIDEALGAWRGALEALEVRLGQGKPAVGEASRLERAASSLSKRVWVPLDAELGGIDRAYLVPTGGLWEVPIGALPDPRAAGDVLAERMRLVYAPIPALLTAPSVAPTGEGALVIGALDFQAPAPASAAQARQRWQRCDAKGCRQDVMGAAKAPRAAVATRGVGGRACGWQAATWRSVGAEVYQVAQTLAKAWSGQTIWLITGDSAQQVALEESMPGRRVLHFGTHGFFAPASQCEGLASYEAGSGGLLGSVVERGGVDPMKLSALVLSGASVTGARQSSADGALTARELVSLDLSAVELATLAACETGRGEVIAGEGAQGLGKAFLVAGAREVIVSLWQVPDRETAVLMDSLYRALPRRYEAGQAQRALSASQRALRGRLKASQPHHVFSWAAFITLVSAPAFGASGR